IDWPAGRRLYHASDQLALDLLRQSPDRTRDCAGGRSSARRGFRNWSPRGRRRRRRRPRHGGVDAGRLHHRRVGQLWTGLPAYAWLHRRGAGPAGRIPRPPDCRPKSDSSASPLPVVQPLGSECHPGVDDRRQVWFVPLLLLGIGGGLAFPALAILAMADATPSDSGLASGLLNTSAQVGGALGLAVLATVSTSRTGQLIAQGQATAAALSGGYHFA